MASFVNVPMLAAYRASKAAPHSLPQAARLLPQPQPTWVFGVSPGPIAAMAAA
ncbi:MAG: hypothetical protein LXA09_02565 [Gemmatimonadetes bacterium]|nr:hypothetical protein [Gemmatimonadota bacterium]